METSTRHVAGQALLLALAAAGALVGAGCRIVPAPLCVYILVWAAFHGTEYVSNLVFAGRTSPHLFLLYGARGSLEFAAVHAFCICEFIVTRRLSPGWHHPHPVVGSVVAVLGICTRAAAIATCGRGFNHYIATDTAPVPLVTTGLYGWVRHPSYTGFFMYAVGLQLVLGTNAGLVGCVCGLYKFFADRIRIEEYFLVERLYGDEYTAYKQRVSAVVPHVW